MKERTTYLIVSLFLVISLIFIGCPQEPEDPNGGDPPDTQSLIWSDPTPPEDGVSFAVREQTLQDRSLTPDTESGQGYWTPDKMKIAYSFIAYIPKTVVDTITDFSPGIAGTQYDDHDRNSWEWEDYDYDADPNDEIEPDLDEYWDHATYLPGWKNDPGPDQDLYFTVYLDDETGITRESIKQAADIFVIFDEDTFESDTDLILFDLSEDTFSLEVETMPKEGVEYTGVASEIIYKEIYFTDYGYLRFYLNDHTPYESGDVVFSANGDAPWKFVYLQHGDGVETSRNNPLSGAPCYQKRVIGGVEEDIKDEEGTIVYNSRIYSGVDAYLLKEDWNITPTWESPMHGEGPTAAANWSADTDCWYWVVNETDTFFPLTGVSCQREADLTPDPNLGGYATWNASWWSQTAYGTQQEDTISGEARDSDDLGFYAYAVYYEEDHQLGTEDYSHPIYEDSRLPEEQVATWEQFHDEYGNYGYDSAVITNIYNDRGYFKQDTTAGSSAYLPRDSRLMMGRMGLYNKSISGGGLMIEPSDALHESIIAVDITLFLRERFYSENDSNGDRYGPETTSPTVAPDDLEQRLLTFIPNVNDEANDADGNERPSSYPTDEFVIFPEIGIEMRNWGFDLQVQGVTYLDRYSTAPRLQPDPSDGPFDDSLHVSLSSISCPSPRIFYTTDGTDPQATMIGGVPSADPSTSTQLFSQNLPIAYGTVTTIKAVCYDTDDTKIATTTYKKASIIKSGTYTFTDPGNTIHGTILKSLADDTLAFIGLFTEANVVLEQVVVPAYCDTTSFSSGRANYLIEGIEPGEYHLCIIIDSDKDGEISSGDLVHPGKGVNTLLTTPISATTAATTYPVEVIEISWDML